MFPSGHKGNIPRAPGILHVDRPSCGHQSHARNRSRPWRGHRIAWIASPPVLHERRRDTVSYDWHGKSLQGERRSRRRRARATEGSSQDGAVAALVRDSDREKVARAVREKNSSFEGAEEDKLCVICISRPLVPVEVTVPHMSTKQSQIIIKISCSFDFKFNSF